MSKHLEVKLNYSLKLGMAVDEMAVDQTILHSEIRE